VEDEGFESRHIDRDPYDGPILAAWGGDEYERWVWVANGTRPINEVFATPRPLVTSAPLLWASLPTDDATVDRIIESFRDESWGLDDEPHDDEEDVVVKDPIERAPDPILLEAQASEKDSPAASVRVIGPVEVDGWREVPDRAIVTELACYLGVHADQSNSGEDLRAALWPDDAKEASSKSLRTYMSLLRKALGPELVPLGNTGGYRLSSSVHVDWVEFQQLIGSGPSIQDLMSALQLVRGRPFAGMRSHWMYSELLVSEIEVAIVKAALQLAIAMTDSDRFDLADWAIGQGLLAVPSDIGLWELQLSIARRRGPDDLRRACRDAEAVLGADAAELIQVATT
jgi:hypothetical protein